MQSDIAAVKELLDRLGIKYTEDNDKVEYWLYIEDDQEHYDSNGMDAYLTFDETGKFKLLSIEE